MSFYRFCRFSYKCKLDPTRNCIEGRDAKKQHEASPFILPETGNYYGDRGAFSGKMVWNKPLERLGLRIFFEFAVVIVGIRDMGRITFVPCT